MKSKRKLIEEEYSDLELLFADGLDDAIVGVALGTQGTGNHSKLVYDYEKCIKIVMKRDKITYEESDEMLSFNTLDAYMGNNTPIFINKI